MTNFSLLKVAAVTVLTGSLGACSFPFMKLPQAVPVETETSEAVVEPAPVVVQQTAPVAGSAATPVVTPVATPVVETGPTAAELAAQEREERRERREERRERSSSGGGDDDGGRDGAWN